MVKIKKENITKYNIRNHRPAKLVILPERVEVRKLAVCDPSGNRKDFEVGPPVSKCLREN